jgi:shikimate kinase
MTGLSEPEAAAEMPKDKIFLVGFMGSGKSTVGPLLAARLGWDFVDLDQEIEREQGMSIREIFQQQGEAEFRRIERSHLRSLKERAACVVALGGGAFVQEANLPIVAELGLSVFLDCRLEVIQARCPADGTRPLFETPELVRNLYLTRHPLYRKSDFSIDVSDIDPARAADLILQKVRQKT